MRLGQSIAAVTHPVVPLVMKRFDAEWLNDLLRRHFVKEFSGFEYFRSREAAVISDASFDKLPRLREVRNDFLLCVLDVGFTPVVGGRPLQT